MELQKKISIRKELNFLIKKNFLSLNLNLNRTLFLTQKAKTLIFIWPKLQYINKFYYEFCSIFSTSFLSRCFSIFSLLYRCPIPKCCCRLICARWQYLRCDRSGTWRSFRWVIRAMGLFDRRPLCHAPYK